MSSLAAVPLLILAAIMMIEAARAVVSLRRARRLGRAMHELRRPLQVLTLLVERGITDPDAALACMQRAREALGELEAVLEHAPRLRRREARLGEVIAVSGSQWRPAGIEIEAVDADCTVRDPELLGAAIDNLVANALEHGEHPVSLRAGVVGEVVEVEVKDAGAISPRPRRRNLRRRSPRRGQGLEIVEDFTARNGGSMELRAASSGTSATISIPVFRPNAGAGEGSR